MTPAGVRATGVLCPIGRGAAQAWAAARTGIGRIGNSPVMNRQFEPIRMSLVPEDALEPQLPPEIELLPLPARARRMLRLGASALRDVLEHAGEPPVRLYLALPQLAVDEAPWMKGFALYLAKTAGVALDAPNSRVVPAGRAGALVALELALETLEREPEHPIIVGGVDSFLDLKLLAALDAEGRLLGPGVSDGFIPGEGAGFIVLSSPAVSPESGVQVIAAASASDPAHRTSTLPARGEGLAQALETLRGRVSGQAPVATVFAGLNGESFDAKQWGVARLRHSDFFAGQLHLTHPADRCGDAGAALGAILLVLAATAVGGGARPSPALVWAASDGDARGCALISAS
jgi:3-oxoacyl-[acyl-carrier-protein] synthase I